MPIRVAEVAAFGRASIRWFHTFDAGKTGQPGAPGSDGAPPGEGRWNRSRGRKLA